MEFFFFFVVAIIIISSFNKSGRKKTSRVKNRSEANAAINSAMGAGALNSDWAQNAKKLNAAKRSAQTGSTTLERYRREQRKRYKKQIKSNSGLWQSKHRIDKNRQRRTDWGSRGDKALLSPSMIGIIGGGLLTVYLGLTALNG